ncbi:condensation domain-containing protein [Streptomyces sp. ME02-8801-2C]|uniref:condensation domain-containing protein n=1 Tax=Streptomyces sp. ME02-8801-2C TaxID=3028680 RepID=UPI0029A9710E|nr:condensation domain-containing protein [Streptomyces sp. ME02-8801-2C]MDX3458212.1 condensation domain-containing protein [Streptomyces sp. ME02-8801-2C]
MKSQYAASVMRPTTVHTVPFSGSGEGNFPLTWAQKWLWRVIDLNAPHIERMNMRTAVDVPQGLSLETTVEAIGELIGRHRTLRTRFYVDESGTPRQAVARDGVLRVEVHETDGRDLTDLARQVSDSLSGTPFTPPEISLRAAVVTDGGVPCRAILSIFHMAVDSWGLKRLSKDLGLVLGALLDGEPAPSADSLAHPSERVEFERSTAGEQRSLESVHYWTEQLSLFGPVSCPKPRNSPEYPQFREVWMKSKAVSVAAYCVARRLDVSVSAVFTGLTAVLLCGRTGHPGAGFLVFNHNRYGRKWAAMYGTLTQNFPLYVAVEDSSLPGTIRKVDPLISKGIFYGQYDPDHLAPALAEKAAQRGFVPDVSCAVNVMAERNSAAIDEPDEEAARARVLLPETRITKGAGLDQEDMNFYLSVSSDPQETTAYLRANTRMFSSRDMEEFLRGMEKDLVHLLAQVEGGSCA